MYFWEQGQMYFLEPPVGSVRFPKKRVFWDLQVFGIYIHFVDKGTGTVFRTQLVKVILSKNINLYLKETLNYVYNYKRNY